MAVAFSRFTDDKGNEIYVNPLSVAYVVPINKVAARIVFGDGISVNVQCSASEAERSLTAEK